MLKACLPREYFRSLECNNRLSIVRPNGRLAPAIAIELITIEPTRP
jgi:hypothetical protein